jgi:hypothetical protein
MATDISTIYDYLQSRVSTLLDAHKRIHNPYDVADNNELVLQKGWGLAVLGNENTQRFRTCKGSLLRSFDVVVTRKYYAREGQTANRVTTEKDLLEDLQILYDDFHKNANLNTDYVLTAISDTGIEPVFTEEKPYLAVRLLVTVEYFRDLTS